MSLHCGGLSFSSTGNEGALTSVIPIAAEWQGQRSQLSGCVSSTQKSWDHRLYRWRVACWTIHPGGADVEAGAPGVSAAGDEVLASCMRRRLNDERSGSLDERSHK